MKKLNIIIGIIISLFSLTPTNSIGQGKLNGVVSNISNFRLEFEVAKVGAARMVDSGTISLPRNLVFVKSVNVESLSPKEKKKLIGILVPMLNDTCKDWYANALLYQINEKDATPFIIIENREEWVRKAKKPDIEYWNSYVKK